MNQVYQNPEPIIPVSDTWLKSKAGQEIYRVTSIMVKLRLTSEGMDMGKSVVYSAAKEVGLKPSDPPEEIMAALQAKIKTLKGQLFEEFLNVERLAGECTKFLSLDRCALVMLSLSEIACVWKTSYYNSFDLESEAKPQTVHADEHEANEQARLWVLEPR